MFFRNPLTMVDPIWAALWLNIVSVDGPAPGVTPMGPLLEATLKARLLEQIAQSSINERHKEALGSIAKEIVTEAARSVIQ